MTTIHTLLEQFRQEAKCTRDLGDKFERLIATYLATDPEYKNQYSDIWLWREWADRPENVDTGIDLVAREIATGDYCAVQCKFYSPDHQLQKSDIDSFFTASGKQFTTREGKKRFTHRLIVSTTDNWSHHAEEALKNQQIPVTRLRVQDLEDSPIDWSQFSLTRPQSIRLKPKKSLRPHQQEAIDKVMQGFQHAHRGKLIMACGTGKTFTALKIAEYLDSYVKPDKSSRPAEFGDNLILFLVPSISLLSQSLREWTAEAERPLYCVAVCSDSKASQTEEDLSTRDLAFPATTDAKILSERINKIQSLTEKRLIIIFSTYQSIDVISEAQKQGVPAFDLVICDEAHRTTGVTLAGNEDSHFVKVHQQEYIKANKRLYMTATPRIFTDTAKTKAQESDAELCSMDDASLYGQEFYRLGFSEAVSRELLSDYKVMVLAVDEGYISRTFQTQLADENSEITLDDAAKIVGCWNGLAKRMSLPSHDSESPLPAFTKVESDELPLTGVASDKAPMRRAVAFSGRIKDSEKVTKLFSKVIADYVQQHPDDEDLLHCEVKHVDGKMNVLKRHELLEWLKANPTANNCHILSNARCLSEGVDVPALDAVIFLNPRNSIVDVVQSVGRVMRKAEGKKYGYVILPICIPSNVLPETALNDNKKYKVVWQVLQALRAHDDRFNATINKIELNQSRPDNIQVIGIGERTEGVKEETGNYHVQKSLPFRVEEWRNAIYAKIVVKCGDRRYWENWAKDVAQIAEELAKRIRGLLGESRHRSVFNEFLKSLQNSLNPSVTEADVIEMLSQHLITKPVFDALFEEYQFTQLNPVSQAMQKMLSVLEEQELKKEIVSLDKFYASVKSRVSGVDNAEGKQKILIELYENFFRLAFPRVAERLGIVYTPVEVVDFIIRSADEALRQEFGVGLTDKGVHILEPFVGTGTFMVRLLQSGLIDKQDLSRKFASELHANEILLLAYYVAAINIEVAYYGLVKDKYSPFPGIVLTDTFQMFEDKAYMQGWRDEMFPKNSEQVEYQKKLDIQVIMGNPPYSVGQTSANDNNQNLKYEALDGKIRETYAEKSLAGNVRNLYDSYIRAIRWASDRIKEKGIVCYVINGSFIDGNAMDGLRKCLIDEFSAIYCFNLRGNQRTSGETSRMEGGKIFGSGSRAGIAIMMLIKNPQKTGQCQLFYHDIGDYLSREEKLKIIAELGSIKGVSWDKLTPNASHDWINQRNDEFTSFLALGDKKDENEKTIFGNYVLGLTTNRDAWVYNFSKSDLIGNVSRMIDFYNSQVAHYQKLPKDKRADVDKFVDVDPKKISWSRGLKKQFGQLKTFQLQNESMVIGTYRPFCKQWVYFNRVFNEYVYALPQIFPNENLGNVVICVTGIGATKDFSALISATLPDLEIVSKSQCFPLYTYEPTEAQGLFATAANNYTKKDNISNAILTDFQKTYGTKLTKEDIFYYVYGILHSPDYKTRFASDLKKMLPRIPMAKDFWAFSKAGRQLAQWHLNYETIEPYPLQENAQHLPLVPKEFYRVQKMQFGKNGKTVDKTTIHYNTNLILTGIPLETYDYIVNGKPALEWIMERYQVTIDKDSDIRNDPNDWSEDPRYIVDLIRRIVRVSLETVKIVNSLTGY